MDCSFTPDGDWFVFNEATGATIERGFKTKTQAVTWIAMRRATGGGSQRYRSSVADMKRLADETRKTA